MYCINRNIVECKVLSAFFQPLSFPGINRNIVECKEKLKKFYKWSSESINRNIVECKVAYSSAVVAFEVVLIETLWNVK